MARLRDSVEALFRIGDSTDTPTHRSTDSAARLKAVGEQASASYIAELAGRTDEEPAPRLITRIVGHLMLVWHDDAGPTDSEWDAALELMRSHQHGELRVLVLTEGGAPSLPQQGRLHGVLMDRREPLKVAVISDHVGVRFVASTLALFTKRIRTFQAREQALAFAYLSLDEHERSAAERFASERKP